MRSGASSGRDNRQIMEHPTFIVIAVGVLLGFYVQAIIGFAAALIALPIIVNVLGIQESVALLSVFFFLYSLILIIRHRNVMSLGVIKEMALGIIIGLFIGIIALKYGSPVILIKALGAFTVMFAIYSFIDKKKIVAFSNKGFLFGIVGGVFSGMFSTGGPLYVMYIYNRIAESDVIRATIIGTMGITNFLRVPMLISSGLLTYDIFVLSLYLIPVFIIALILGQLTYSRIDEKLFKKAVLIVLVISGVSLLVR
jgi:uncharacterized protein